MTKVTPFYELSTHNKIKQLDLSKSEKKILLAVNQYQQMHGSPPLKEGIRSLIKIHYATLASKIWNLIYYGLLLFEETKAGKVYKVNRNHLYYFYKNGKPEMKDKEDTVYYKYTELDPEGQERVLQRIIDYSSTLVINQRSTLVNEKGRDD